MIGASAPFGGLDVPVDSSQGRTHLSVRLDLRQIRVGSRSSLAELTVHNDWYDQSVEVAPDGRHAIGVRLCV